MGCPQAAQGAGLSAITPPQRPCCDGFSGVTASIPHPVVKPVGCLWAGLCAAAVEKQVIKEQWVSLKTLIIFIISTTAGYQKKNYYGYNSAL